MRPRVLIADDDRDIAEIVRLALQDEGFEVVVLSSLAAVDVRSAVRRLEPAVILLDGQTPAGFGGSWDAALWVAERAHPVPVIMLTVSAGDAAEARAGESDRSRHAGFTAVIEKPFDLERLVEAVRRAAEAPPRAPASGRRAGEGALLATLERLATLRVPDLRSALEQAAQLVAEAFRAEKVDAWLPEGDHLRAVGVSDTPLGRKQVAVGLHRAPIEGSFVGAVYSGGEAVLTGHAETDARVDPRIVRELGIHTMLAAPMEIGERSGVLLVASPRPAAYGETDLGFLSTVARWVGLVAQRAEVAQRDAALLEARAAVAARDEFLSIASHELRNPLAALRGTVQLLRRRLARGEPDLEHLRRSVDALDASAARLVLLADDLLDISRIRTGQLPLRPRATDLAALVQEEADRAGRLAPRCRVKLEVECEDSTLMADPDRLQQVLSNLLDNAAKYSPEGSVVTVRLASEGGGLLVAVSDQGIGLAPGTEEPIFEAFGRAPNAAARKIPGLGMGLYVSRQIALAHGGRLRAESAGEGRGSTFTLWLPRHIDAG